MAFVKDTARTLTRSASTVAGVRKLYELKFATHILKKRLNDLIILQLLLYGECWTVNAGQLTAAPRTFKCMRSDFARYPLPSLGSSLAQTSRCVPRQFRSQVSVSSQPSVQAQRRAHKAHSLGPMRSQIQAQSLR